MSKLEEWLETSPPIYFIVGNDANVMKQSGDFAAAASLNLEIGECGAITCDTRFQSEICSNTSLSVKMMCMLPFVVD
jgi:hypothetical protein